MRKTTSQKINLLNKATLDSIREENKIEIIKKFTNIGIEIFEADFGFAWSYFNNKYELVYKSPGTPCDLKIPKKKNRSILSRRVEQSLFDSNVKKKNYADNIDQYMKSYVVLPVNFGDHMYGNIALCYKKPHKFTKEELSLADTIANTVAQAITIRWLIESEQATTKLVEKQRTTETLLSQEKLKTEFIANATHELRTPLAIMKGNVDLALMDKGNLKIAQKTLTDVNVEINILSDILKDLALLTTSGQNVKHVINPAPVNMTNLIDKLAKRLKAVAKEKNITIRVTNKKNRDLSIVGNERYLEKLFVNLIKNAITYGKENGNIIIDLRERKNTVKIKITDDGMGISKEDLPKIFERFYRGDKAHTHNSGNQSGLGLAIAKWAAEIHGGTIEAKSALSKSSTFIVTLPKLN